jgi:hypothetical protein
LYAKQQSLYGVVGQFAIHSVDVRRKRTEFTITQLWKWIKDDFGMSIPKAVLIQVVKKYTEQKIIFRNKECIIADPEKFVFSSSDELANIINIERSCNEKVLSKLYKYIATKKKKELSSDEKKAIEEAFCLYLIEQDASTLYDTYISAFILDADRNDPEIKHQLSEIKEGLLLYVGLTYQDDCSDFQLRELHIILDTEVLFDCAGYNGALMQEMFGDFISLVNAMNRKAQQKNKKPVIYLRYFDATHDEVNGYFNTAESILLGKATQREYKEAMNYILEKASDVAGISNVVADYQKCLRDNNIEELKISPTLADERQQFNIDFQTIHGIYDQYLEMDMIEKSLQPINYVSLLRRERNNNTGFKDIRYIFLTRTRNTLRFARELIAQDDELTVPLATDMEFLTSKLWVLNNNGLLGEPHLNIIDVSSKARVTLASSLNESINNLCQQLQSKAEEENWDAQKVSDMRADLLGRMTKPEIVQNEVDEVFEYEQYKSIEEYRENRIQREKENESLRARLSNLQNENAQMQMSQEAVLNGLLALKNEEIRKDYDEQMERYVKRRNKQVQKDMCKVHWGYRLRIMWGYVLVVLYAIVMVFLHFVFKSNWSVFGQVGIGAGIYVVAEVVNRILLPKYIGMTEWDEEKIKFELEAKYDTDHNAEKPHLKEWTMDDMKKYCKKIERRN